MQETGFSQQLDMGPENQSLPQGKHNAVPQSQIQNSSLVAMLSPAKLICINCKLTRRFLLQVLWYYIFEQCKDHPDDVMLVPEKNQKQVCFMFWNTKQLFIPPHLLPQKPPLETPSSSWSGSDLHIRLSLVKNIGLTSYYSEILTWFELWGISFSFVCFPEWALHASTCRLCSPSESTK